MIQHVFLIHSHTLFLTAMGVIDLMKVDRKDVVFLYSRHYNNTLIEPGCKVIDVTNLVDKQNDLWNNKKRKSLIKDIDKLIDNIVEDKFILYSPHFAMSFAQVLYTNNKCLKAAYIQEGGMVFRKVFITHLPFWKRIRCFITDKLYRHTNRIWSTYGWYMPGCLYKQKNIDSYAISEEFFRYLPSTNHIIKWPHINISLTLKDNATIFIFDGFVKNGVVEPEFYLEKCKKLIHKFAQENNYIKFHPAQSQDECKSIATYFEQQGCKYEILDNSTPFEIILTSTTGLTVIGFGSSLLYFARDLGHTVHCMDKWLQNSYLYMQYKNSHGLEDF